MAVSKTSVSLCLTCAHAPDCSLTKKGVAAVLNCEEFEPGKGASGEAVGGQDPAPEEARTAEGIGPLGLCVNCGRRETCSLSKPEGGIWHCEEYETE